MNPYPCDTCGDSGFVWREGPDGRDWMFDCDNDDCNAFGQLEEFDDFTEGES